MTAMTRASRHPSPRILFEMTWEEVRGLPPTRAVPILPVGAVEAHGPHLPLGTDGIIALAMARSGALRLAEAGHTAVLLPELSYTSAAFAAGFPGTIPMDPTVVTNTVISIARGLYGQGFGILAIANAHLDPGHLESLRQAADALGAEGMPVAFPDLTRRRFAERLTEEFRTGACHAGRFEGSIVLAERPDLVHAAVMRNLPPNPASLSDAIREGKESFEAAGGESAYFGWPAEASAEEGLETIAILGEILAESVLELWPAHEVRND